MTAMKKYMGRSTYGRLVIALAGVVCGVLGIIQFLQQSFVVGGILLAVCVMLTYSAVFARKQDARYMQTLSEQGELGVAAYDFRNADEFADDTLMLGQIFAFRKGAMEVLRLRDMKSIYLKQNDGGVDDALGSRLVMFVEMNDGRSLVLCNLFGTVRNELAQDILTALRKRIPNLEVK